MPDRRIFLLLAPLALVGCGAIGDPLPPTLDIPQKITDLRVMEKADKLVVDFTIPELTTEGLALRLEKVDLRAGTYTKSPFNAEDWAAGAKALDTAGLKPGPAHLELEAGSWIGQEVFFRVRAFSRKGRDSGWSDFVAFRPIPPLAPPPAPTAAATENGVSLNWSIFSAPAGLTFRIFRRTGKGEPSEVGAASAPEWLDRDAQFGETYEYTIQAALKSGASAALSAVSPPVTITPVDKFPPAVPKGLEALAGSASIELSWEQNTESDLRGYYVYRAAGEGAWERLGDVIEVPDYSDRTVKPGTRYRYAISAIDRSGNESQRSAAVETSLP